MHSRSSFRLRRAVTTARRMATQVCVSVVATFCASALFGMNPALVVRATPDKVAQRLPDGAVAMTTLRYDPQQSALLASLASFTPVATPAAIVTADMPAAGPIVKPARAIFAAVLLPPPRPMSLGMPAAPTILPAAAPLPAPLPAPAAAAPDERGWRIAGVAIPTPALPKVDVADYVPDREWIARGGAAVWRTGADAVRSVSSVGTMFGRVARVPNL
jgi:hypothetical protein